MRLVIAIPRMTTLILWDIDHTLVDIGEISREIYELAFEKVVGAPLRELADMRGRTERAILIETLSLHDVPCVESRFDGFYAALAEAAHKLRARMCTVGRRLPGAAEAILALTDENVVQTVVTGNIKPIAVTKLEAFGLLGHLDVEIGGYGSDADSRPPLIRQAWCHAENKYGQRFDAQRILMVGDTPLDVAAAREVGVHSLGIATGSSTVDDLVAAQADVVLHDLPETEAVVQAFNRALL